MKTLIASIIVCLALILLGAAMLSPRSPQVENLNAVSGVFVVLFALVAVWVELRRDRRTADAESAHRQAIDHRVGTLAFTLHRQLTEWAWELTGPEEDLAGTIRFWGEMREGGGHPSSERIYAGTVAPIMTRWRNSARAQDIAERRLQELQTLAPEATARVRDALERAFVRFYEFAGRFNHQSLSERPEWKDLVVGLQNLRHTILEVEAVVTPRLLELARQEIALPPSPLDELASALAAQIPSGSPSGLPAGEAGSPGSML